MKPHKTWLQTAVRAHQVRTLDHLQRTQQAQARLSEAEQRGDIAARDLSSLRQDWASQRSATPPGQQLDALYSRFHGHLSDRSLQAEHAKQACRAQMDAATAALRQSHAIQRNLEKVAKQRAEDLRHSATAKEMQLNAEAWLLGRIATKPLAALDPRAATDEPRAVVDGGAGKTSFLED